MSLNVGVALRRTNIIINLKNYKIPRMDRDQETRDQSRDLISETIEEASGDELPIQPAARRK